MPVKSQFPDIIIEDLPLNVFIRNGMDQFDTNLAMVDGESGEKWTFNQMSSQSDSLSCALQDKLGLKKGDVILFYLPNCPRHAIAILASLNIGAVVSGCNPVYNSEEVLRQIRDCGAKVVVTDTERLKTARKAVEKSNKKLPIVVFGKHALNNNEFDAELLLKSSNKHWKPVPTNTRDDVCILPYSSGTTGVPKGVMLTHYNIVSMLQCVTKREYFLFPEPGDYSIDMLPFFHIFGILVAINGLRTGVVGVTMRKFEPRVFLGFVQQYKVDMLYVVPPIVVLLAKHSMVDEYDLSSITAIVCGAAPLGEKISTEVCTKLPNIKHILQGYGMTETSGAATIMKPLPLDMLPYASCGVLIPNCVGKVIEPESGKELGENERGEICCRGPGMMKGYLNKQQQTDGILDKQGWIHTGDIGYYDGDGFFYIVDRLKELIKVKGFQVAPAELEDHLLNLHEVADAAVVGVPDEKAGELPVAFVVKKQGSAVNANHIMQAMNEQVAPYKRLSAVYFIDELPKSPSGKILRRILKDQLNQMNSSKL